MGKGIFITATDTHVGKTIATLVLATLFRERGVDVGVMKPVQCGGNDASFLKEFLKLEDTLDTINPCCAPEPLSPHLAFRRARSAVSLPKIRGAYEQLCQKHGLVLVEGAGGLMVPLNDNYYTVDLIRDLKTEIIIVSRLGLGTINHTLLSINQAKACGITVKGILFSQSNPRGKTIAEETNPTEIGRLSGCRILGIIPYLPNIDRATILDLCTDLRID